jgi:hypothetical protein
MTLARGLILAIAALVLGLVALNVLDTPSPERDAFLDSDEPGRWWELQPGETFMLPSDRFNPMDRYSCPGHRSILFTPQPGAAHTEDGGLWVMTEDDGTVIVSCAADPAG